MFATKRSPIEISEDDPAQLETTLQLRKTLKTIQPQGIEKENFKIHKPLKPIEHEAKKKKAATASKGVQTGESTSIIVTAEDLVSESPSDDYWRVLAEKRGEQLDDSFREIERLKEEVDHWKRDNAMCQQLLDESKNCIQILQDILAEKDEDDCDD